MTPRAARLILRDTRDPRRETRDSRTKPRSHQWRSTKVCSFGRNSAGESGDTDNSASGDMRMAINFACAMWCSQQDAAVANPVLANADVVAFADSTKSSCACEAFSSDSGKPKTCFPTFENVFRHNRKHATRAKKTGSIQKNCRAAIFCAPCSYLSRCIFSTY